MFPKRTMTALAVAIGVLLMTSSPPTLAQCEVAKFSNPDPAQDDLFGHEGVSICGDWAVVGAHDDDEAGNNAGAVYVLRRGNGTWGIHEKLIASDAAAGDLFGYWVSCSDDCLVVGAQADDDGGTDTGSVYVFCRDDNGTPQELSDDSWIQRGKLHASDAEADDRFGRHVSISGDWVLVGAGWNDEAGSNAGAAYLFAKPPSGWGDMTETQKIVAHDPATYDLFGYGVAIDGDYAVVGSHYDDDGGTDSGSAYVFVNSNGVWSEQDKLTASDPEAGDQFGGAVSISGEYIVVGAPADADGGVRTGLAYVFWHNDQGTPAEPSDDTWDEQDKLTPGDGHDGDQFGYAVSIAGNHVVAGAPYHDAPSSNSGSAYVFINSNGNWIELDEPTARDAAPDDFFGQAVSISGNYVLAGAPGDDEEASRSGSAYMFVIAGPDCNENGNPDECDVGAGTSQDCNSNGTPDECDIAASPLSSSWLQWHKDRDNPLIPGIPGMGNDGWYWAPTVLHEPDGTYRMWMEHIRDIFYSESADGVVWSTPTLQIPRHTYEIAHPWVIKDSGLYKMWFMANNGSGVHGGTWIEYATSLDGYDWTMHGPVLTAGPSGSYDYWNVATPAVVKLASGSYNMYYSAAPGGGSPRRIALATSPDGESWTKEGIVLEGDGTGFDAGEVLCGGVLLDEGIVYLFYTGSEVVGSPPWQIGIASSTDGVTFVREASPLLPLGAPEEFDNHVIGQSSVLRVGNEYMLWYEGMGWDNDYHDLYSIGLARRAVQMSDDCNANGIPDECDLADCEGELWCGDCNTNGMLDGCEPDFDGDGAIDDCDPDIDDDGVPNEDDACDYTPSVAIEHGRVILEPGHPLYGTIRGDLDGDCDCDLEDYSIFQADFTGTNG